MLIKNYGKLPSRWQILKMMPEWWNLIRVWGTMGWHPRFLNYVQDISRILHKVYIESIDNGRLPLYLTQGLITPNPKAQKDILLLDNWRPISLLSNDYKIIAVCLVKVKRNPRWHNWQLTIWFCDRQTFSTNMGLALDDFDYSNLTEDDIFILFLAFYKMLDPLHHQFLFKAFGSKICLFTNAKS